MNYGDYIDKCKKRVINGSGMIIMNNSKFNVACQDILSSIKAKDELIAKQQRLIDRLHGLVYTDYYGDLCLSSESIEAFQKAIEQLQEDKQ